MPGSKKYPTLEEREPVSVEITRFTKEDAQQANREFKEGMSEYFKEIDGKLARSRQRASEMIVRTLA